MGDIRSSVDEAQAGGRQAPRFAPAGQSTQMIVGADSSTDANIIDMADTLYRSYRLRRIYYSAFSPFTHSSPRLPNRAPPLMREHRLYQADWLMRYYGFSTGELKAAIPSGHFDLDLDPKTTWALRHREQFPVDVNTAAREQLLRVPGLGVRAVDRIVASRKQGKLRYADLITLGASLRKARHFLVTADYRPHADASSSRLRGLLAPPGNRQSDLFQSTACSPG
jgi:predicted DNA-binding helix-hairpin-helix protein